MEVFAASLAGIATGCAIGFGLIFGLEALRGYLARREKK